MCQRICSVEGCGKEAKCQGLCWSHYMRRRRHGDFFVKRDLSGLKTKYPHEYMTLKGIRTRCLNKNDHSYRFYGAKGIKLCDRWQGVDGFKNFIEDMGPRPCGLVKSKKRPAYSIDRIDPNGDYCPENCRWADTYTQAINKKNGRGEFTGIFQLPNGRFRVRLTHQNKEYSTTVDTLEEAKAFRACLKKRLYDQA